ncbi:MAG: biopolymer transporter ExbD [Candidatus Nealsonbacteria bacterium]|nr:biopolymer transporter ExbD [Candidatus Nealsonbacteria bacterium]
MRVPANTNRAAVDFNMTPMIDIVFLLIIFFLVSSHFAQQEVQVDLDLPSAAEGRNPQEDDARRVVVNVLSQQQPGEQIVVAGRPVDQRELTRMIAAENNQSKQAQRRLEVRIRSDRRVPYRIVEPIMAACAEAGVWKVTFAVTRKRK